MINIEDENSALAARRILETTAPDGELEPYSESMHRVMDVLLNDQIELLSTLAPAELARFNYLQRRNLALAEGWGYLGDNFSEYFDCTPEQFTAMNMESALKLKTKDLFTAENDSGATLADIEEYALEQGYNSTRMDRHVAAEIIECITDGATPNDLSLVLSAARRLAVNSEDDFQNVLQGILDARRKDTNINKEVAEVILRSVVEEGSIGHWPADIICSPDQVLYTDLSDDPDGAYIMIRRLAAYDFGIALGSMLGEEQRLQISEAYGGAKMIA
jgi:hypothetical protein